MVDESDEEFLLAEFHGNHVRGSGTLLSGPVVQREELQVPSEDGSVIYVFDRGGRHLRTQDAGSARILTSFGYL